MTGELAALAAVYALFAYPIYRVARATSDHGERAWFAWVPILNLVLMCRIAGMGAWNVLLIVPLAFFPVIGWIYPALLWVKIGQRFDKTVLGMLACALPVIGAWIFAFVISPEEPAAI